MRPTIEVTEANFENEVLLSNQPVLVDGEPQLDPSASGIAHNERNEPVSLIAVG